jgi:hypothetical protein
MNKTNRAQNWDVEYRGLSGTKQHMFSDAGSPIVSYVLDTLDQAIVQFGQRIKINDNAYRFSAGYRAGLESKTYAPRTGADKQERLEYGLGYLRTRLNQPVRHVVATPVSAPQIAVAVKTVAPTRATLSQSIASIAKKRGRPAKAQ